MTPEEAFDGHHQAVYRFAYRLTRRADVAEDITQECFLALVRAPERFDALRGTIQVFLFAIARNLALKHYRRQHPAELGGDDVAPMAIIDPRETLDVASAVAAAVSDLPPLQKEALVLFEYEGATLEEIAQIVRADVDTVKSRLHRARERLRGRWPPIGKWGMDMEALDRDHLSDRELDELLTHWKTPAAPASLKAAIFAERRAWWQQLWSAPIRLPLPAAVCLTLALVGVAIWQAMRAPRLVIQTRTVEFQLCVVARCW